ncbi:hypothetical protein RIF29_41847 [Crotalaria pallida]|uniref:Uncharacterized protein n=1 Tax=Crotalaria pallida TaxID=3830 RepID=A0AAN9E5V3_CROPI
MHAIVYREQDGLEIDFHKLLNLLWMSKTFVTPLKSFPLLLVPLPQLCFTDKQKSNTQWGKKKVHYPPH